MNGDVLDRRFRMIPKGTAAFYGCLTLQNSPLVSDTSHSNA